VSGSSAGTSGALVAAGSGRLAPGLTVEETSSTSGGLSGTPCTAPGTDFWFAGASADSTRADTLQLTDVESEPAAVSVALLGPDGEADDAAAADITVQPGSTTSVRVASLVTKGVSGSDLALHVTVNNGRVAAALHADAGSAGADWLPATTAGDSVLVPGLPGDTSDARLVVAVPGSADADLKVQLASQTGWITPAGHETVHVSGGTAEAFDLGKVTHGEPAALRLSPSGASGAVPIVAGIQITRSTRHGQDESWLAGSAPVGPRATAAGSTGSDSTLLLTAAGPAASVTVTSFGPHGSPASKTVRIASGVTTAVPVPQPSGVSGPFAVTVTPSAGSASTVYAARMIARSALFTIDELPSDRSTVQVPDTVPDVRAPLG